MVNKATKVLVGCILAFSLVLIYSLTQAATQPAQIKANGVNIRANPNTDSDVVTTVSAKSVSIIDEANGWYKVTYSGKSGWVLGKFITPSKTNGSINADGVNFRESSNTSSKILDSLNKGESVVILDTKAGFHKVQVGSKTGYVAMKFVSTKSTNSQTPSRSVENVSIPYNGTIAEKVIAYAKDLQGVKYVYGANSPSKGFDCSGFVGYVFNKVGIDLERSSADMASNGVKVSKSDLKPGDVIFFHARSSKGSNVDHVGLYLGGDKFIHASTSKNKVVIETLSTYRGKYLFARRVI